ncbi:MAG: alpha/beta fold hydrolase [Gammaproteobacteria bacterium]|nr:alpha/beta fold hydrolase [Gammaproteobacteria bacterium]
MCWPETVVLVHGLWMTGLEMSLLRQRLRRCGFVPRQFSYPTVRCSLADNAVRLQRFIERIDTDTVHFVAHSLGGLLLRQFFHDYFPLRPGRVVTLGTPHAGSVAALRMAQRRIGRLLLGKSLDHGLRGDVPAWTVEREIGVIAGDLGVGLGRLVGSFTGSNDGVVTLTETRLPGMTDYRVFHTSHSGLLFSPEVAMAVCTFLREGRFLQQGQFRHMERQRVRL